MKKKIAFSFIALLVFVLTLAGCSDFAFNPVGKWHVAEERLYADSVLSYTKDVKDFEYGGQTTLVFKKTGTGYIDSGARDKINFTYEYDDKTVTINIEKHGNIEAGTVVYDVADNGNEIVATIQEYEEESGTNKVNYKKQTIFRR
ncbi:MAG: hypothetical protein IJU51_03020 [Clostridia bacterium]|nr:hypothetical protein [Clostridia bacterium]